MSNNAVNSYLLQLSTPVQTSKCIPERATADTEEMLVAVGKCINS